jgi:hypothetical protein
VTRLPSLWVEIPLEGEALAYVAACSDEEVERLLTDLRARALMDEVYDAIYALGRAIEAEKRSGTA